MDIDTQEKIDVMMQAWFPKEEYRINYKHIQATKKMSICAELIKKQTELFGVLSYNDYA